MCLNIDDTHARTHTHTHTYTHARTHTHTHTHTHTRTHTHTHTHRLTHEYEYAARVLKERVSSVSSERDRLQECLGTTREELVVSKEMVAQQQTEHQLALEDLTRKCLALEEKAGKQLQSSKGFQCCPFHLLCTCNTFNIDNCFLIDLASLQ